MKLIIYIMLIMLTLPLAGVDAKFIEKIRLDQKDVILQRSNSFVVTEDDVFIVVDYKSADVKLYNKSGKLLKVMGRKGMGPNEFGFPMLCDYDNSKLVVMDFSRYRIFLYNRTGKSEFKLKKEIYSLGLGYDMVLNADQLLISGHKTDKNKKSYELYIQNVLDKKHTLLLPSQTKYGFGSYEEYQTKYHRNDNIPAIGVLAYCDWSGDDVYFAWQGDLRIVKKNIKTGKVTSFGYKDPGYIKPYASKPLLEARSRRDGNKMVVIQRKMSYVLDIFSAKDFVGLIYGNEGKESKWKFTIQLYTHEGKFLGDQKIEGLKPAAGSNLFFFRKDTNMLYYLYHTIDEELEDVYEIIKYKISK